MEEKKRKEAKARVEAKEEANLTSKPIAIIPHLFNIHGIGVVETALINYNQFSEKKKEKYRRKFPEKGCIRFDSCIEWEDL